MKKIGIVVCNYNKSAYVVNCVRSLQTQSIKDFDIYVVDNASSDDSVWALRENFGTSITILENQKNLGGSGGFNTGIRQALQENYEYIMLLDNDVVLDENAVEELYNFLEVHKDVGMVGSKIFSMDSKEMVMAFGSVLNYKNYEYRDCYAGIKDSSDLPEVNYCDYVPACSLMIRKGIIDNAGLLPERNFVYWDDIEWACRIRKLGYKVAAIGKSKVWHKGGGRVATSTFPLYYFKRNQIRFWAWYLDDEQVDSFLKVIISDLAQRIYGSRRKGKENYVTALLGACEDAVYGIAGKARDSLILPLIESQNDFKEILDRDDGICFIIPSTGDDYTNETIQLIDFIEKNWEKKKIYIASKDSKYKQNIEKHLGNSLKNKYLLTCEKSTDVPQLILCRHVKDIEYIEAGEIYVDPYTNIVKSEKDLQYYCEYKVFFETFKFGYGAHFKEKFEGLRKFMSREEKC